MGERALVAVERPDGRYDLRHSQWGGAATRLRAVLGSDDEVEAVLRTATPVLSDVAAPVVADYLDPREYELLYVVGDSVTVYLVCRLGTETAGRERDGTPESVVRNAAALVPLTDATTATRLRRFLRPSKAVLADAVDAGLLPQWAAIRYLGAALSGRPDVPEETMWLPSGWWERGR